MSKSTITFNKYGLYLQWPHVWIIILGLILIFLCLSIAGMEVGHTIFDLRRSTAFGGFIVFIPLMICAIFVLITAYKPRLIILRITVILCCIMIILCMALIAYDILVLIDPSRCYFLNCNDASVDISNSTHNIIITGWPLYITWPNYFQTNMNAKRIFQSIQIFCAGLFILFVSLYILTYIIYRHIRLYQQIISNADLRILSTNQTNRMSRRTYSNNVSQSYPQYNPHHKVTTYMVESQPYTSSQYHYSSAAVPSVTTTKTFLGPRASSANYDRLCTRCNQEPRMILTTYYERKNLFPYLCIKCNNELVSHRRIPSSSQSKHNPIWRP
ncbi:unnamed protein product [Rotaria sp. Silwood1]|nr:unnamed protein product [Rotaria sp. Silwood1]CAF1088220.1 unnamed protein product [Rotaria sp. Silwood1]CAF1110542.1 unnamed protein product [Rotaria sp. Silwood1]CAF3419939.1 unnamed protein product [Rotaria sp. Silwood1]CAF3444361.1 unnamed protein product [Rotaria sp. Silwood1]